MTGRISAFLPFLPFSPQEQAAVAHKFFLELAKDVRSSVRLQQGPQQRFVGNIRLHMKRDATSCLSIAEEHYDPRLGARPLMAAVEEIREELTEYYLSVDEHIAEGYGMSDYVVDVIGSEILVTKVNPRPAGKTVT
jgi:ATP-dependent Clp protease ATP-binding subunit ClpA